jgi:hypothetical protein
MPDQEVPLYQRWIVLSTDVEQYRTDVQPPPAGADLARGKRVSMAV